MSAFRGKADITPTSRNVRQYKADLHSVLLEAQNEPKKRAQAKTRAPQEKIRNISKLAAG